MSRTLLFGDDGSACADVGWLWINNHDWPDWSVEILNAGVSESAPTPRELLRPTVAESLSTTHTSGDPRWELHTRGAHSDLVVVGAKGQGFLKRLHLGSTAEWLMHGPCAPLVITRTGRRTRRVLLAQDGSVHAQAAQEALIRLPWISSTEVLVVVVHETADPDALAQATHERLMNVVGDVELKVVRPGDLEVFSRPRDLILQTAEDWQADLIALGSRGLTAWESINEIGLHRAGSTASGVTQHAHANVLLAQARPVSTD